MAHAHEHPHDNSYYLDQLCTLISCAALGGVAIMMYMTKTPLGEPKLSYILAPQFFLPVLIGGIALLFLVAIRAAMLWRSTRDLAAPTHVDGHTHNHQHAHDHGEHGHHHHHHHEHGEKCDHDHHHHEHGEQCGHEHHDCGHDHSHDHDHDHGVAPAKYAVLMLPVVLYFLNLPNSSFNPEMFRFDSNQLEGTVGAVADKGAVGDLGFKELSTAALTPASREFLEGKFGKLKGMFSPLGSDKEFTLYRVKMTCCAADAIPLEVRIVAPENVTRYTPKDWVEVEGQIQFHKLKDREKYLPVLVLKSADAVRKIPPQPDYEY